MMVLKDMLVDSIVRRGGAYLRRVFENWHNVETEWII
jgi:hypothetical protein